MRKLSIILALAMAMIFALGISTAFAAGEEGYGADSKLNDFTKNFMYDDTKKRMLSGNEVDPLETTDAAKYGNANKTGLSPLSKAVQNQTVHGQYMRDTNSCASCHMTHSAAGAKLLFKKGIYNTCTACHDGTLTYYNVLETGSNLQAKMDGAQVNLYGAAGGTFRGEAGKGASLHLATGNVTIKAAPGGDRGATKGSWVADFTCASCHAPHGSYSDRLLHYNPNNVGNTPVNQGGYKKTGLTVADVTYEERTVYVVDGTATAFEKRDDNPWLYGYDLVGGNKQYWTNISVNGKVYRESDEKPWVEILKVNYGKAFFEIPANAGVPAGATLTMDVSPAMVVKLGTETIVENAGTVNETTVKVVKDYGNALDSSKFCAACHTDYNQNGSQANVVMSAASMDGSGTTSVGSQRGTFTLGFRHNIDREIKGGMVGGTKGTMACLTCHYAHGTTEEIMLNADNTFANGPDQNSSSALKRYVNMAVCWRCHNDSQSVTLKNNEYYWNNPEGGYQRVYSTLGIE